MKLLNFRFLIPVFFGMILLLQPMTMNTSQAQSFSHEELEKERAQLEKQRKIFEDNHQTIQLQINQLSSILNELKNSNVSQDKIKDVEEQLEELYDDKSKLEKSEIDLLKKEAIFKENWNKLPNKTSSSTDNSESISLPPWFKSNAKWWKQGIISEQEVILAIENLIETDIIQVDLPTNPTTNTIQKKQVIPSYVKDVFGFWSDDLVSDEEIGNSLQYLIKNDIIRSEKITEKKNTLKQSNPTESNYVDILEELYNMQEFNAIVFRNTFNIQDSIDSELQGTWKQIQKFVQSAKNRAIQNGVSEDNFDDSGIPTIVDDFNLKKYQYDFLSLKRNDPEFLDKFRELYTDNYLEALDIINSGVILENNDVLTVPDYEFITASLLLGQILEEEGQKIEFNKGKAQSEFKKQLEPVKPNESISGINSVLGDLDPICFDGMCLKASNQDTPVVDVANSTVCVKDKCFTTVKEPEKENTSKRYVTTGGLQLDSGNCNYPACASMWFQFTHSDSQVDRLLLNFTVIDPNDGLVLPGINGRIYVTCDMDGRTFEIIPETVDVGDNEVYVGGAYPYKLFLPCQEGMIPSSNHESKQDTDGDGINNLDELKIHRIDPLKKDTDGDGINDGDEIKLGLNPIKQDTDGDGIEDGLDEDPKKFSNFAVDKDPDGTFMTVRIIERNGNDITVQKINNTEVRITVDFLRDNYGKIVSGGGSVTIESLGIILELEVGTSIDTSFG